MQSVNMVGVCVKRSNGDENTSCILFNWDYWMEYQSIGMAIEKIQIPKNSKFTFHSNFNPQEIQWFVKHIMIANETKTFSTPICIYNYKQPTNI